MPSNRYVYVDRNQASSCTQGLSLPIKGTFDDGANNMANIKTAPSVGPSSVASYVDGGVLFPNDNSYWYASGFAASTAGTIRMTMEPFYAIMSTLEAVTRNRGAAGDTYIQDIYVFYDSGKNSVLYSSGISRVWVASGEIGVPFTYPTSPTFTNYNFVLTMVSPSGFYQNLMPGGTPEVEFNIDFANTNESMAEFNLYGLGSTTSDSNQLNLYMFSAGTASGTVPLYTSGAIRSSGSCDLYMYGQAPASGSFDMFLGVVSPASGQFNLFLSSLGYGSGNVDLYMLGSTPSSGNVNLYILNIAPASGVMNLHTRSALPVASSGIVPLSLWATTNSGQFATVPLSLNVGSTPNESVLNLYTGGGGVQGNGSGIMNLVLSTTPQSSGSFDMIVWNTFSRSSGNVPFVVRGLGVTDGAIPSSGVMNLFINRAFEGLASSAPLYMLGPVQSSGNVNMYLLGGYPTESGNVNLTMKTQDSLTARVPFYTHGF